MLSLPHPLPPSFPSAQVVWVSCDLWLLRSGNAQAVKRSLSQHEWGEGFIRLPEMSCTLAGITPPLFYTWACMCVKKKKPLTLNSLYSIYNTICENAAISQIRIIYLVCVFPLTVHTHIYTQISSSVPSPLAVERTLTLTLHHSRHRWSAARVICLSVPSSDRDTRPEHLLSLHWYFC